MAELKELEGIVLYQRKYKERDFLVKIFLKNYGKLMFYVRGSKNPNFPMKQFIQPFTHATYIVDIKKSGLSFIRDAKFVEPFINVQQDIFRNAYATYICGLIDASMEDRKDATPLFNQLYYGLRGINQGLDAEVIMNTFEVKLLYYFGVLPELNACTVCGNIQGPFDYSSKYGGVICSNHFQLDPHRLHADPRALYYLSQFLTINLASIEEISINEETKKGIREVLDYLYEEYVGVHLKSKDFIKQMKKWGQLLQKD